MFVTGDLHKASSQVWLRIHGTCRRKQALLEFSGLVNINSWLD